MQTVLQDFLNLPPGNKGHVFISCVHLMCVLKKKKKPPNSNCTSLFCITWCALLWLLPGKSHPCVTRKSEASALGCADPTGLQSVGINIHVYVKSASTGAWWGQSIKKHSIRILLKIWNKYICDLTYQVRHEVIQVSSVLWLIWCRGWNY